MVASSNKIDSKKSHHVPLGKKFYLSKAIFTSLNLTIMFKLFLSLAVFLVMSCNNSSDTATDSITNTDTTAAKSYNWDSEDEKEFLAQCMLTAKGNLSDTLAYAQCNCVLAQLEKVYPSYDSANVKVDSAMAAQYAANCR